MSCSNLITAFIKHCPSIWQFYKLTICLARIKCDPEWDLHHDGSCTIAASVEGTEQHGQMSGASQLLSIAFEISTFHLPLIVLVYYLLKII